MDFNDAIARVSEAHHYMDTLRVHPDSRHSASAKREVLTHLALARQKLATAQLHHIAGDHAQAASLLGYHPRNTTVFSHLSQANWLAGEIREHPDTPQGSRVGAKHLYRLGDLLSPVQDDVSEYEYEHNVPETYSEEDEINAVHEDAERASQRYHEPRKALTPEDMLEHHEAARKVIDEVADNTNIVFGGKSPSVSKPPKEPGFY